MRQILLAMETVQCLRGETELEWKDSFLDLRKTGADPTTARRLPEKYVSCVLLSRIAKAAHVHMCTFATVGTWRPHVVFVRLAHHPGIVVEEAFTTQTQSCDEGDLMADAAEHRCLACYVSRRGKPPRCISCSDKCKS